MSVLIGSLSCHGCAILVPSVGFEVDVRLQVCQNCGLDGRTLILRAMKFRGFDGHFVFDMWTGVSRLVSNQQGR